MNPGILPDTVRGADALAFERPLQAPAPSSVFTRILRTAERHGFGRLVRSAGELAASAVNAVAAARHRDVWRS